MANIELGGVGDSPKLDPKLELNNPVGEPTTPPALRLQFTFTIDAEGWMVTPQGKRLRRMRFAADW